MELEIDAIPMLHADDSAVLRGISGFLRHKIDRSGFAAIF
jgi:hypothetical protein